MLPMRLVGDKKMECQFVQLFFSVSSNSARRLYQSSPTNSPSNRGRAAAAPRMGGAHREARVIKSSVASWVRIPSVLPAIWHRLGVATSTGAANFWFHIAQTVRCTRVMASERVRGPSGRRDYFNPVGPVVIAWRRDTTTAPESAHEVGCPGLTPGGRSG